MLISKRERRSKNIQDINSAHCEQDQTIITLVLLMAKLLGCLKWNQRQVVHGLKIKIKWLRELMDKKALEKKWAPLEKKMVRELIEIKARVDAPQSTSSMDA